MRVHQSHIVNLYNIASIDRTSKLIYLRNTEETIQVSDTYIATLAEKYDQIRIKIKSTKER